MAAARPLTLDRAVQVFNFWQQQIINNVTYIAPNSTNNAVVLPPSATRATARSGPDPRDQRGCRPRTVTCFSSARDVMAKLPVAIVGADFGDLFPRRTQMIP